MLNFTDLPMKPRALTRPVSTRDPIFVGLSSMMAIVYSPPPPRVRMKTSRAMKPAISSGPSSVMMMNVLPCTNARNSRFMMMNVLLDMLGAPHFTHDVCGRAHTLEKYLFERRLGTFESLQAQSGADQLIQQLLRVGTLLHADLERGPVLAHEIDGRGPLHRGHRVGRIRLECDRDIFAAMRSLH